MSDVRGFPINEQNFDMMLFDDMLRYGIRRLYSVSRFEKIIKTLDGVIDKSELDIRIMCKLFEQCCLVRKSDRGEDMYSRLEYALRRLGGSGILYEREYQILERLNERCGRRQIDWGDVVSPTVVVNIDKVFKDQSAKITEAYIMANMLCKFIQDSESNLWELDNDQIWNNYVNIQSMTWENYEAVVTAAVNNHHRLMNAHSKRVYADASRKKIMTRYEAATFKKLINNLKEEAGINMNVRNQIIESYRRELSNAYVSLYECLVRGFLKNNVTFLTVTADYSNSELRHATAYKGNPMDGESQYTLYTAHWSEDEYAELEDMICRIIGATVGKPNALNMFMNQFKLNSLSTLYQYLGASLSNVPAVMAYLRTLTDGTGEVWQDWICNAMLELEIEVRRQYKTSIVELLDGSYYVPELVTLNKTHITYTMTGNIDQTTVSVVLGDGKSGRVFMTINKDYADKLRTLKKVTITGDDVTVCTNANVTDNIWYYLTGKNRPADANPLCVM